MTNADKLIDLSIYELLCDMNESFMNGEPHCIIETVSGGKRRCLRLIVICNQDNDRCLLLRLLFNVKCFLENHISK